MCSHRLRWSRFCSFGEGFVAAFPSCFSRVEGSGDSVFFRALVGYGCFRSPGTSSRSSLPLNGCYPAVLQFQHFIFHLITAFWSTAVLKLIFENFGIPSQKVEIVSFQMIIILQKLATLKGFWRKTKTDCLNSWTPCNVSWEPSVTPECKNKGKIKYAHGRIFLENIY